MEPSSRNAAVSVHLFGAPCAVVGGAVIDWTPERAFQLLAYLAASGDWVTRDRLAALFWPERGNAAARSNLRFVLARVRGLDFAGAIEQHGAHLRWRVSTDLAAFEQALAERRDAEAVASVRGMFLDGLDDLDCEPWTEWLESERGRLAERWRTAALRQLPRLGPEAALALVDRMLALDALDDDAVRARLAALAALGRRAQAQRAYAAYRERLAEELGLEPSAATRAAARELDSPRTATPRSPPPASGALHGRSHELAELTALLAATPCRLVTIIGPGGIGKTRLAQQAVAAIDDVPVHWVSLADLTGAPQIGTRLASALGIELRAAAEPLTLAIARLRPNAAVVFFDNCEHVAAPVAQVLAALLDGCPLLRVVATSRRRIGIAGEALLPLAGLAGATLGDSADAVLASPAAGLFVEHARAALPGFDAFAHAQAIGELCRLTEGLPLALLLAAAWVRVLSCAEIVAELRAGLELLVPDRGNENPGVRAAFERSWQLAAPHERGVLARLSVFSGGFARDAARAVARASVPALASLVDASLLSVRRVPSGNRFQLHPLLREFAREKLALDAVQHEAAIEAHGRWFLQRLAALGGGDRVQRKRALDAVEEELENSLAAWRWAADRGDAELLAASARPLLDHFEQRGAAGEGIALFESALQQLEARVLGPATAELACALARLLNRAGHFDAALPCARRALRHARSGARRGLQPDALNAIGSALWALGRYEEAARQHGRALALARTQRRGEETAAALGGLALIDQMLGRYDAAETAYREQLLLHRGSNDLFALATSLNRYGDLLRSTERYEDALPFFEEGLALCEAQAYRSQRGVFLIQLAVTLCELARLEPARAYGLRALTAARDSGAGRLEVIALETLARIDAAAGDGAAARRWIAGAMQCACAIGNEPLQLESASIFGEVLAKEGLWQRAAPIWAFVARQAQIDDQDRRRARELLALYAREAKAIEQAEAAATALSLEALVHQVIQGGAALAGSPVSPQGAEPPVKR